MAVRIVRPIFIWGAPRSGTTLLYQLVARHNELGCLGKDDERIREGTGLWWRAFGECRSEMDEKNWSEKADKRIRDAYKEILVRQGKARIVDKTPFMVLWVQLVERVFPDARHIHVIRDGRAVWNSVLWLLRHGTKDKYRPFQQGRLPYGPWPKEMERYSSWPRARQYARQWVALVRKGRSASAILGERYHEIKYESLVGDVLGAMGGVFKYLGIKCGQMELSAMYPESFQNKNYKWQAENMLVGCRDGFSGGRAISEGDKRYIREMEALLQDLGYAN